MHIAVGTARYCRASLILLCTRQRAGKRCGARSQVSQFLSRLEAISIDPLVVVLGSWKGSEAQRALVSPSSGGAAQLSASSALL